MSHRCCSKATDLLLSRRQLISRLGGGIAGLAFAELLGRDHLLASAVQSTNPLAPKRPPLPAKAKAIISIFCYGGVSQSTHSTPSLIC